MDVFNTPSEAEFIQAHYHLAENISIDYAIMEKAPNVFVKEAFWLERFRNLGRPSWKSWIKTLSAMPW